MELLRDQAALKHQHTDSMHAQVSELSNLITCRADDMQLPDEVLGTMLGWCARGVRSCGWDRCC